MHPCCRTGGACTRSTGSFRQVPSKDRKGPSGRAVPRAHHHVNVGRTPLTPQKPYISQYPVSRVHQSLSGGRQPHTPDSGTQGAHAFADPDTQQSAVQKSSKIDGPPWQFHRSPKFHWKTDPHTDHLQAIAVVQAPALKPPILPPRLKFHSRGRGPHNGQKAKLTKRPKTGLKT